MQTRIVTYYIGLSSLGLWGFNFFETLSFYLNQKVSAIFILSESKSLMLFSFSHGQLIFSWLLQHVPEYSWLFLNIPDTKHKNNQKCDQRTNQRTEPPNYYNRYIIIMIIYCFSLQFATTLTFWQFDSVKFVARLV